MNSAQVVETSVTNNSLSQDSNHPDDLFQSNFFKAIKDSKLHLKQYYFFLFQTDNVIVFAVTELFGQRRGLNVTRNDRICSHIFKIILSNFTCTWMKNSYQCTHQSCVISHRRILSILLFSVTYFYSKSHCRTQHVEHCDVIIASQSVSYTHLTLPTKLEV